MRATLTTVTAGLLWASAFAAPGAQARDVMFVANAEGATVAVVDAKRFRVLRELDVVPDGRQTTFGDNPTQALVGQQVVTAAGGENFAQDQDISPDGRTLYVSRGHRGDVAAFDLASGELLWKVAIPGLRSDHMTISKDGARLYVSALTDDHVHVIDTRAHAISGSFPTGEWPHDNHLSHDGALLYNGSIGNIVAPEDSRGAGEPPYVLTVVDAVTLEERGRHVFERGIRPFVITHDERRMFLQLSEYHGVAEFDLETGEMARTRDLPIDDGVTEDDYDFEAPHHGLAMTPDERTLCAAGRASDYVALLSTDRLRRLALIEVDDAPGWTAISPDGRHCFAANNRGDTLSVISIRRRREVRRLEIGDGPKQIEAARVPLAAVCAGRRSAACRPRLRLRTSCAGRRPGVRLRGELDAVERVVFRLAGRRAGIDRGAPFIRRFGAHSAGRRVRAHARATTGPRRTLVRNARLPRCDA